MLVPPYGSEAGHENNFRRQAPEKESTFATLSVIKTTALNLFFSYLFHRPPSHTPGKLYLEENVYRKVAVTA